MAKLLLATLSFLIMNTSYALGAIHNSYGDDYTPMILLWIFLSIFLSRMLSVLRKIGIPIIVAEILTGLILGDLHLFGIKIFDNTQNDIIIKFLAELGAIILMFEIGIQSKFSELKSNFKVGFTVAIIGTAITFGGGFCISKILISNATLPLNLLMGVIAAATATGISARTFRDMKIIHSHEVKIVLVSSIIDELFSIFCFGIISSMVITDAFSIKSISITTIQLIAFFSFAAIFGNWITPFITHWSTKIHAGINMKIGVLFSICLLFSWVSYVMGLATVVGAFIAGLILDQVYFSSFSKSKFLVSLHKVANNIESEETRQELIGLIEKQERTNLEELLKPFSHMFTPIFFIYIGLLLNVEDLLQIKVALLTLALLFFGFIGRIISGFALRGKHINRFILGLGMTPIGEAGLIFALFGREHGIISSQILSSIVATLVISSILTPIFIQLSIKRYGVRYDQDPKTIIFR